ncbi:hypothetical protein C2845_PM17G05580 [Panicum miliaceum]|uniref:Retrotransposon gag domain-containing protein n=1 Tax=Panicum miliaceum TaxID=4540 RepID=A0A3L6Q0B1_PANMI|nr:hypothetical protein C2845_PM17G05580 [Panicum miliaceum]
MEVENETLRLYTRRFFDTLATIANIADEDVIRCFRNGLATKKTYREFRRNLPTIVVQLRDMMRRWADQEDEENDSFPKCKNDKGNKNNRPDWVLPESVPLYNVFGLYSDEVRASRKR